MVRCDESGWDTTAQVVPKTLNTFAYHSSNWFSFTRIFGSNSFLVEALQWPSLQVVAAAVDPSAGRSSTIVLLASSIASVPTVIVIATAIWIVPR
jgi:hypothetical protein